MHWFMADYIKMVLITTLEGTAPPGISLTEAAQMFDVNQWLKKRGSKHCSSLVKVRLAFAIINWSHLEVWKIWSKCKCGFSPSSFTLPKLSARLWVFLYVQWIKNTSIHHTYIMSPFYFDEYVCFKSSAGFSGSCTGFSFNATAVFSNTFLSNSVAFCPHQIMDK